MIKVLIVEDEFTIALDLEERLKQMDFNVVGIASDYDKALSILLEQEPDIALLDINLGDSKSGVDLGKLIFEKLDLPIVFLSAYSDENTFKEAQSANPMGFIIKPFKDADLHHTISLALERYKDIVKDPGTLEKDNSVSILNPDYVFIRDKGKTVRIQTTDILWLEAMDNYTIIHTKKGKYIANSFLKTVLSKLNSVNIIRIHKSHAVAINNIIKIEDNLIFIDKVYLVISRKYKKELMDKLNLL